MKGQLVMSFQVPNRGLITNVPPHLVGPDALVGGMNVFVDLDGLLKTRRGILPVGSQLVPAERVIGIGSYEDNAGGFYPVVGTTTRWQALIGGGWTDLSGGSLLHGTINDPARFTSFASGGTNYIIGSNNNDQLHQWNSTAGAYSTISASPIARDVLTIANRVVCFNTVESGTRYPFRVRWGEINDQTTWPALNFADLTDSGSSIIGAILTSRLSAIIYRQFGPWYIEATQGGDANAFTFDRVPGSDNTTGPASAAAIVSAEGNHYYFGVDGRIYQFNGVVIQPISDPVDPVLRSTYNSASITRFQATYVPQYRQLVFFYAAGSSADPQSAIVFDLRRQAFEPVWQFPVAITASSEVRESLASISITSWANWVNPTATWLTIPWATWDSIPGQPGASSSQLSCYVGDSLGNVYRLGVGNADNGVTIPYSASWGLLRGQNELQNSLVHYVEFYQAQTITMETVVASILGYFQPFAQAAQVQNIAAVSMNTADQTTFYSTLPPGPANAANLKANLLQLSINSGGSFGQLAFGGATLLLEVDFRGDPRQLVINQ